MTLYKSRLVDSMGVIVISLTSLDPTILYSIGYPEIGLKFGCKALHLFPLVTGVSLSDDNGEGTYL